MTPSHPIERLLAGPRLDGDAERLDAHVARLGALPLADARRELVPMLEASGLLGRGGAGFPVGRKWRALAESSQQNPCNPPHPRLSSHIRL